MEMGLPRPCLPMRGWKKPPRRAVWDSGDCDSQQGGDAPDNSPSSSQPVCVGTCVCVCPPGYQRRGGEEAATLLSTQTVTAEQRGVPRDTEGWR